MFFYTANFTSPAFCPFKLFPTRLSLSRHFYHKKRKSKMPTTCKVVGLWPRFHATIWLLRPRSREHIFVVLQKAMTLIFFSVVSWGCKLLASWWRQGLYFLCCIVLQWASHNDTIFTSYREGASNDHLVSRGSKPVYNVSRYPVNLFSRYNVITKTTMLFCYFVITL